MLASSTVGVKKIRLGMILANSESMEATMRQRNEKDLPRADWQKKAVWSDMVW